MWLCAQIYLRKFCEVVFHISKIFIRVSMFIYAHAYWAKVFRGQYILNCSFIFHTYTTFIFVCTLYMYYMFMYLYLSMPVYTNMCAFILYLLYSSGFLYESQYILYIYFDGVPIVDIIDLEYSLYVLFLQFISKV